MAEALKLTVTVEVVMSVVGGGAGPRRYNFLLEG